MGVSNILKRKIVMEIITENLQKKLQLNLPQITKIAKRILELEGVQSSELSIVFVSSQKIRAYNKKFLNRNHATDVLAFDMSEEGRFDKKKSFLIGDIIISTDAAIQNAKAFKTSINYEIVLYVIHGILHLLGFDDHKEEDIKKMRKREKFLLEKIKIESVINDS